MTQSRYELGVLFYNEACEFQETDVKRAYEAMKMAATIFYPLFNESFGLKILAEKSYILCNRLRLKANIPLNDFFLFREA